MIDFRNSRGFTLLEILIVVALIGVLATFVISIVNPVAQFNKGRDARRKTDLRQIQTALELYRADQGQYPAALPGCNAAFVVGTVTYIQRVPCDPKNTGNLIYRYVRTSTTAYSLIACFENVNDPEKDTANNATYCNGGTTNWSYTLLNP